MLSKKRAIAILLLLGLLPLISQLRLDSFPLSQRVFESGEYSYTGKEKVSLSTETASVSSGYSFWSNSIEYPKEDIVISASEFYVPTNLNVFSGYMLSGNELNLYDNDSKSITFKSEGIEYHYVIIEFEYNISITKNDLFVFDVIATENISISVKYYNRSFGYYVEFYNAINTTHVRVSSNLPTIGGPIKIKFIVVALANYEISFNSAYFVRNSIYYKAPYFYETSKTIIANFSLYVIRGQKIIILNDTTFMELLGVIGSPVHINYTEKSIIFISEGRAKILLRFYDYWNYTGLRSIILKPVIDGVVVDPQLLNIYYRWSSVDIIANNEYNFSFARRIRIINRNPYPIDNFTVRIVLNSSIINMFSVLPDLEDLAFVEVKNGSLKFLESYLAQWDGENAVFYVRLDHLDAYSEKTIYIFYGSRSIRLNHNSSDILTYGKILNIQNITDEGIWQAVVGSVYGFISGGIPRLSIYPESDKSESFVVSNISFTGGLNMTILVVIDDYTIQSQQYNFTLAILSKDLLRGLYISVCHGTVPYLLVKYRNYSFIAYSGPIALPDGFDDTNYYFSLNLDPLMKTISINLIDGINNTISYTIYDSIDITGDYWKLAFIHANISYLPVSFYGWDEYYYASRIEFIPVGDTIVLYNITRSSSDMITWKISSDGIIFVPSTAFVEIKIVDILGGLLAKISDILDNLEIVNGVLEIALNGSMLKINNYADYGINLILTNGVNITNLLLDSYGAENIILSYGMYELVVKLENSIVSEIVDILYIRDSSEYIKDFSDLDMLNLLKDNITIARIIKLSRSGNKNISLGYINPYPLILCLKLVSNNLDDGFQYFENLYQSFVTNFGNYSKLLESLQISSVNLIEFSIEYFLANNKLRVVTFDGSSEVVYEFQNVSLGNFINITSKWKTLTEFLDLFTLLFKQVFWKLDDYIAIKVDISEKQISFLSGYINASFVISNKTMYATVYRFSTYLKLILDALYSSLLAVDGAYAYNLTAILDLESLEKTRYGLHGDFERNVMEAWLDNEKDAEILFDIASYTVTINLKDRIALQVSVMSNIFTINGNVVPEGVSIISAVDVYFRGHSTDFVQGSNISLRQLLNFREITIVDWYTDTRLPEGSVLIEINNSYVTDNTEIRLITTRGKIYVRIVDVWFSSIIFEASYENETFKIPIRLGVFAVINELNASILLKIKCTGLDNRTIITSMQYKSSFLVFLPIERQYYVEIWLENSDELIFNSTFVLKNSSQRPIQVLIIAENNTISEENSTIQNTDMLGENNNSESALSSNSSYKLSSQTLIEVGLIGLISLGVTVIFIKRRRTTNSKEVISAEKLLEKILEDSES